MIREIAEQEAFDLAEEQLGGTDGEWPILFKEEWESTESAVCLKQMKPGYLLGVSCDMTDQFKLFVSNERDPIEKMYLQYVSQMQKTGNPFSGEAE